MDKLNDFEPNSHIDNIFYCSICFNILNSTIQPPCGHLFCTNCIFKWYDISKTCPLCRSPFELINLHFVPSIDYLINQFKFKCKFLCGDLLSIEDILKDKHNCGNFIQCPHSGCPEKIHINLLNNHIQNCLYQINSCAICEMSYFRKEYLSHLPQCKSFYVTQWAALTKK